MSAPRWFALMRVSVMSAAEVARRYADERTPPMVLVPRWTTVAPDDDWRDHSRDESDLTIAIRQLAGADPRADREVALQEALQIWREMRSGLSFMSGVPDLALRPRPAGLAAATIAEFERRGRAGSAEQAAARQMVLNQHDDLATALGYQGGDSPGWNSLIDEVASAADEIRKLRKQVAEMGEEMARAADPERVGDAVRHLADPVERDVDRMLAARGGDPPTITAKPADLPHVVPCRTCGKNWPCEHRDGDGNGLGANTELVTVAISECVGRVRAAFERHCYEPSLISAIARGVRHALIASGMSDPPPPGSIEELDAVIAANCRVTSPTSAPPRELDDDPLEHLDGVDVRFVEAVKERAAEIVARLLTGMEPR